MYLNNVLGTKSIFKKSEKSMNAKMYNAVVNVGDTSKGNQGYVSYHKISSLERFKLFLGGKYSEWKFATIYDHETKEKIEVIKR